MATSVAGPGQLLADIQVTGLAANQTGFYSVSGLTQTSGSNSIQMTPNSVNSTQPLTDTYWHALYLDYEPGVLNAGQTAPDIQLWFHVDEQDYSGYMYVDLTMGRSMISHRENTNGRGYVKLGNSMILAALTGNFPGTNGPLMFTGPKVSNGIDFWFASTSGFSTSATDVTKPFASPPPFKLWGDVSDQTRWTWVVGQMGGWKGAIGLNSMRRTLQNLGSFSASHAPDPNFGSVSTVWPTLPDGPKQTTTKVYRMMKFATPILAVAGTAAYVLSNKATGINGKPGQVGLFNELAWTYSKMPTKAVQIELFGRQPAAGTGYFGLTKGQNNVYPSDTGYGVVDTVGNPRAWYGNNSTYTGIAGQYDRVPQNYAWVPGMGGPEVIAGEDAGYFVAAQNGATITANTDYTAVIGYQVD